MKITRNASIITICIITSIIISVTRTNATDIVLNVADGNWTNSVSWNPAQIPVAGDNVTVRNGGTVHISSAVACANAYPGRDTSGGVFDISSNGNLTVSDYLVAGVYSHTGPAIVTQSGGIVNCGNVRLGQNVAAACGDYIISDGLFQISGSMYLGQKGTGTVTQTGGIVNLGTAITYMGMDLGSYGRYDINGGAFTGRLTIAYNGFGYFKQSGGRVHIKNGLNIGAGITGTGTYELVNGTLIMEENIYIGGVGNGTFLLGDVNTTGLITETNGARRVLIGNFTGNGTGTLRGWGTVGLTQRLLLYANGTIIADGYGIERVLDFSSMDAVMQTYTNAAGEAGAIYAQNHGKVLFPTFNVGTYTYYFGESADWKTTNVVNCAVVTLDMQTGTTLSGAILSPDRDDVNKKARLAGVWEFVMGNPAALNSAIMTFRYDEVAVANLNIAEEELELLRPDGDGWKIIPATIDTTRHTITCSSLTNIDGQFAVGSRMKGTVVVVN